MLPAKYYARSRWAWHVCRGPSERGTCVAHGGFDSPSALDHLVAGMRKYESATTTSYDEPRDLTPAAAPVSCGSRGSDIGTLSVVFSLAAVATSDPRFAGFLPPVLGFGI